jgi:hypothetical protein
VELPSIAAVGAAAPQAAVRKAYVGDPRVVVREAHAFGRYTAEERHQLAARGIVTLEFSLPLLADRKRSVRVRDRQHRAQVHRTGTQPFYVHGAWQPQVGPAAMLGRYVSRRRLCRHVIERSGLPVRNDGARRVVPRLQHRIPLLFQCAAATNAHRGGGAARSMRSEIEGESGKPPRARVDLFQPRVSSKAA